VLYTEIFIAYPAHWRI